MSKSAMTPSFRGRMAWMCAGVRPIIRLASGPTASGRPSLTLTATTDGSLSTMPSPAHVDEGVGGAEIDRHVAAHDRRRAGCRTCGASGGPRGVGARSTECRPRQPNATISRAGRPVTARSGRRGDACRSGRRTGRSEPGEPEGDLAGGRLGAVGAVDQVLGGRGGEVAPDGAGLGVADLGRADQGAAQLPGVLAGPRRPWRTPATG